ncbi:hypothetical protein GSI_03981 [Ganoderma sinense ZZ0214-1]|uniref:Uncharacterized protein n=1 Tax=Ganoderma sinense ZZ0214-1 TaxID=1077348 RepID=A0A2G8SHX2_9APHY|nr:hypothetical protein GSI_03981 [Ganoderma sinense ZZ0214-1]
MLIIIAIITVIFLLLALSSNIALVLLFREMSKLGRLELVPPILRRVVINNDEDDIEDDIVDNDDLDRTPHITDSSKQDIFNRHEVNSWDDNSHELWE